MTKLPLSDFKEIVKNTPLISIDLIVENEFGEILLGWRKNRPAQGYWFVPGGRILKDETFKMAFSRIVKSELGCDKELEDGNFLGVYEHLYPNDNFLGEPGFGTHYIVIGYRLKMEKANVIFQDEQHDNYWWASLDDVLQDENVHPNTANYFNGYTSFSE